MKLLFDQNLSPRLIELVSDLYPGSVHVREAGLHTADDETVWNYALRRGYTIVSKDSDFRQMSFLIGPPPKVVWIRRGNCSTQEIKKILRAYRSELIEFSNDKTSSFLELA